MERKELKWREIDRIEAYMISHQIGEKWRELSGNDNENTILSSILLLIIKVKSGQNSL